MSDEKKKPPESDNAFPNPLKMFGEMYDQALRQTAEQWEETARSPLFLATMANNVEQTMQMQRQLQEMMTTALQALNLPTKEDFLRLVEKIDELGSKLAEIDARLDRLAAESTSSKGGKTKS